MFARCHAPALIATRANRNRLTAVFFTLKCKTEKQNRNETVGSKPACVLQDGVVMRAEHFKKHSDEKTRT